MSLRLGIDIDGTVTNPSSLIPIINKAFNKKLSIEHLTDYDLSICYEIEASIFHDWFQKNEYQMYEQSFLADGAKEILTKWQKKSELYFISARHTNFLELTREWFHRQQISYDNIELIGSHHKIEACNKAKVDVFFEDKHDNAVNIHLECGIPVILFDTPYNRDPIPSGVIRVKNWYEADQWLENWIQKKA